MPSRCRDASQASRTYSGRPLTPSQLPSGLRWLPNLVAITYESRLPAIALPTSTSFVNGPYTSEVSRKSTPSSRARWIVAIDSASSRPA